MVIKYENKALKNWGWKDSESAALIRFHNH